MWEPSNGSRVDLTDVENTIIALHERFELSAVAVDPFQAEMLVQRLQRRGIPSELLYFPNENHWVLKPADSAQWYATVLDWLSRWTRQ